jgi:hypothetical protein
MRRRNCFEGLRRYVRDPVRGVTVAVGRMLAEANAAQAIPLLKTREEAHRMRSALRLIALENAFRGFKFCHLGNNNSKYLQNAELR